LHYFMKVNLPMAKKRTNSAASAGGRTHEDRTAALLEKVDQLLTVGKANEAFNMLNSQESGDPLLKNARGVCLLRMGQAELAVRAFRQLCLTSNGIVMRNDIPLVYKTNFATALLMNQRISGALEVINEARNDSHPAIQRLRQTLADWEKELSPWQRILWQFGVEPQQPVKIAQPCGDLLFSAQVATTPASNAASDGSPATVRGAAAVNP